jgi:hypothetical protein
MILNFRLILHLSSLNPPHQQKLQKPQHVGVFVVNNSNSNRMECWQCTKRFKHTRFLAKHWFSVHHGLQCTFCYICADYGGEYEYYKIHSKKGVKRNNSDIVDLHLNLNLFYYNLCRFKNSFF